MAAEERALALVDEAQPAAMSIVRPIATPQEMRQAIKLYEEMKAAIAMPKDWVHVKGGGKYLKKPYWRRVALAFGIRLERVGEERIVDPDTGVTWIATYRAVAPNGQHCDGDGAFSSTEVVDKQGNPLKWSEHLLRARAHTRAKNRAISDLVAGGEVSADELRDDEWVDAEADAAPARARPAPAQRPQSQPQQSRAATQLQGEAVSKAVANGWGDQSKKSPSDQLRTIVLHAKDVGADTIERWSAIVRRYTGREWSATGMTMTPAEIDTLRNWVISREVKKARGERLPDIAAEIAEPEHIIDADPDPDVTFDQPDDLPLGDVDLSTLDLPHVRP